MIRSSLLSVPILAMLAAACCDDCHHHASPPPPEQPRRVSILVEVYDPVTNLVWENVSVRVVQADQEWSGCTCVSPWQTSYLTDGNGRVLLDEFVLGDADVGFVEDELGRALIYPQFDADEATVLLEVFAVGFVPVTVAVPLDWLHADVFVAVPFR